MTLKGQIQDDMKTAMKAGDKDRLKVVRLILAAITQVEVDERTELTDAAVLGVLNKMVKQRRDSVKQFKDGGRDDLADIETAEIGVIEEYLPEQMSDDELDAMIGEAITETGGQGNGSDQSESRRPRRYGSSRRQGQVNPGSELGVCAVEISVARKCHREDSFSVF
jgi:uncharacterized protein YqeY